MAKEETPTGLTVDDLEPLDRAQKLALADWHLTKAGSNDGRLWLPRRIRAMPLEGRMQLALDPEADLAWEVRELRRVQRSLRYFVAEYGAVQPNEGPPIPFDLWPEQEEVLQAFIESLRVIILKARQLGLTWLALHEALWLMAFNPATPNAKVLALSKVGEDAKKLLGRVRKLNDLLPPYLRQQEDVSTRESNTHFKLRGRGAELISLMSTPRAAASETATAVLVDEAAHIRNEQAGDTMAAVIPTLGETGRLRVIFTGNGEAGDGAAAAELWHRARTGTMSQNATGRWKAIFLSYLVHPERRRPGWRDEQEGFLTKEARNAEYPETEDEALQGPGTFHIYARSALAAAANLGRVLEGELHALAESEGVLWGTDWGDFQTFTVWAVPLPMGGLYVFDELVQTHTEPTKASEAIIHRDPGPLRSPRIEASFADSAPIGTNRTFARVLREAHKAEPDRFPDTHTPIVFGEVKEGGNARKGINTVAYIQYLLDAAETFDGDPDEAAGLLAIHPTRCPTLLAQMRNLEKDAKTGKVKKPTLDPRHIERGDHGPDALVSVSATRAARFRAEVAA